MNQILRPAPHPTFPLQKRKKHKNILTKISLPKITKQNTKKRIKMHFSKIIMAHAAVGAGSAAVLPRLAPDIACVFPNNQNTCILTFETNSGTPVDLSLPAPIPFYGKVLIYNPTCINIGATMFGLNMFNTAYAWELSLDNPLKIGMVKVDGNDWYSPLFDYDDVQYGIDNGCSCWEPIGQPEGIHYCSCEFTCHPFEDA
jgi:hypothetical protein